MSIKTIGSSKPLEEQTDRHLEFIRRYDDGHELYFHLGLEQYCLLMADEVDKREGQF